MSEPPADAPNADAASETEDAAKTRRWLRPHALLLQAGATAGAIASIIGLFQFVVASGDDTQRTTNPTAAAAASTADLSLEPDSVRVMTRREHIRSLGFQPQGEELDEIGFTVSFRLETRGYRPEETLLVCYRLQRVTETGDERPAAARRCDTIAITRDREVGTPTSTFMPLPDPDARYLVRVDVYPPGATEEDLGHPIDPDNTSAEFGRRGSA